MEGTGDGKENTLKLHRGFILFSGIKVILMNKMSKVETQCHFMKGLKEKIELWASGNTLISELVESWS